MIKWVRLGLVAALALWTIGFARTPISDDAMGSFLHLPDLVFHEAGHILFAPFGRFMTVLGGSLLQFLIPVFAVVAFVRQGEPFSAAVCTWWAGQNLVDLAPYIADAQSLRLTLLGGRTGAEVEGHDWEYLLNALGVSQYAQPLGYFTHFVGILLMIGALAYATMTVLRKSE
jgi:hypothetical protein